MRQIVTINMSKKSALIVACIAGMMWSTSAIMGVTNTASFMESGYHPDSQALGMTGVSHQTGASSTYWNTAQLGMSPLDKELSVMTYSAFETQFIGVDGVWPIKNMPIGISYRQAEIDGFLGSEVTEGRVELTGHSASYKGWGLIVGTGKRVSKKVGVGAGLKIIQERGDQSKASGIGMDLGVAIDAHERVKLGINIQNIIQPTMTWNTPSQTKETVPMKLRLGSSTYSRSHKVGIHNELILENGKHPKGNWGVGYRLHRFMDLNAGINQDNVSLGVGLRMSPLEVGFSWTKPKRESVDAYYKLGITLVRKKV